MSFITTQSIGTAAVSQGLQTPGTQNVQQPNPGTHPPTQADVSRITQAAATTAATKLKTEDPDRVPQLPKKVEANFAGQKHRPKSAKAPKEEDKEPPRESLDLKV